MALIHTVKLFNKQLLLLHDAFKNFPNDVIPFYFVTV